MKTYVKKQTEIKLENKIRQIDQLENDESFATFNAQLDEQINTMVIKVNLIRAEYEDASFFKEFVSLIITKDIKHYILDFSDTVFLDSTFLGSIIYFFKQVNTKRSKINLVIDQSKITILSEVFNLAGVNIFMTLKEAKNDIL